jgi:hypothetical protein
MTSAATRFNSQTTRTPVAAADLGDEGEDYVGPPLGDDDRRVARQRRARATATASSRCSHCCWSPRAGPRGSPWRPPDDAVRERDRGEEVQAGFRGGGLGEGRRHRAALERLCRYGARPAFAQERLAWTADRRIAYKLKRPWPDGRTHLVMEPVAFLRRLVGIIPPPRRHLVRYSGIFGPASKHRHALRALVPADPAQPGGDARCAQPQPPQTAGTTSRARRLPWADLLRRVFRRRRAPVPLRWAPQRRRHRHRHRARPLAACRTRPRHRTRHLRPGARSAPSRPPLGRRLVGLPLRSGAVCPHPPERARPYVCVIEPRGPPHDVPAALAQTTAAKPRLNFLAAHGRHSPDHVFESARLGGTATSVWGSRRHRMPALRPAATSMRCQSP